MKNVFAQRGNRRYTQLADMPFSVKHFSDHHAFLENTLIQVLVALHKDSLLHLPSKLLLRDLATTDLCVGIIAAPLTIIYWMSPVNERWNICRFAVVASDIASFMLCLVSVLTLAAMSVDRQLALSLVLRDRQVRTLRRTCLSVFTFWFVSTVAFTMHLWDYRISYGFGYIVISLCQITSIYCYTI